MEAAVIHQQDRGRIRYRGAPPPGPRPGRPDRPGRPAPLGGPPRDRTSVDVTEHGTSTAKTMHDLTVNDIHTYYVLAGNTRKVYRIGRVIDQDEVRRAHAWPTGSSSDRRECRP